MQLPPSAPHTLTLVEALLHIKRVGEGSHGGSQRAQIRSLIRKRGPGKSPWALTFARRSAVSFCHGRGDALISKNVQSAANSNVVVLQSVQFYNEAKSDYSCRLPYEFYLTVSRNDSLEYVVFSLTVKM
jgi:hypothetical protein